MNGKTLTQAVQQERRGAVMLLIMAQRPVNALTLQMRLDLATGLAAAAADPTVQAVVICSDIGAFSAGADAAEGQRQAGFSLADLCLKIERMSKPVVAAINGKALGAGLELALAAHARLAEPLAQVGLPDVSLGIVPGAGGTQRLTRLIGAGAALRLLLEPTAITASQALAVGLLDQVVEHDLRDAAVALATTMALQIAAADLPRGSERRDGLRDAKGFHAAVIAARSRHAGSVLQAPLRAIDCVEAAQILPPEQGLAYEAAAHSDLIASAEARALRHVFFAERRATFPPRSLVAAPAPQLGAVAIWGAGAGMAELAVQALSAGFRVVIVDSDHQALSDCLSKIAARQEQAVTEGRQSSAARDADWARLTSSSRPEGLAGADLVLATVDAGPVPVNAAVSVTIGALPARAATGRVALSPAMAAGLVAELSHTADASTDVMMRVLGFGRRLGWRMVFTGAGGPVDKRLRATLAAAIAQLEAKGIQRPVIAAALGAFGIGVGAKGPLPQAPAKSPGILRACLGALANQGARLLAEGVAKRPSDVDAIAVLAGIFPRWQGGPMFQADQQGLLVLRADLRKLAEEAPQIYAPQPMIDALIAEGRNFSDLNRAE